MKTTILFLIALTSLNVFSAEVGEDKKGECEFGNQSGRAAKVVEQPLVVQETRKEASETKSK